MLHAISEHRSDLFVIYEQRWTKLLSETVEKIVGTGVERTIAEGRPKVREDTEFPEQSRCSHFSEAENSLRSPARLSAVRGANQKLLLERNLPSAWSKPGSDWPGIMAGAMPHLELPAGEAESARFLDDCEIGGGGRS